MKTSESIMKIAPALLKAQRTIGSAVKGSTNPFFKSSYADLGAVMEACKDALNENGISVLQPVSDGILETVLLHESGEFISDGMKIVSKSETDPQAQGSAITYARRYGLQSMVFIPAEDDDGNKASGNKLVEKPAPKPVVSTPTKTMNVPMATEKQKNYILSMAKAVYKESSYNEIKSRIDTLDVAKAKKVIEDLQPDYDRVKKDQAVKKLYVTWSQCDAVDKKYGVESMKTNVMKKYKLFRMEDITLEQIEEEQILANQILLGS